jgi:hypothetical protein
MGCEELIWPWAVVSGQKANKKNEGKSIKKCLARNLPPLLFSIFHFPPIIDAFEGLGGREGDGEVVWGVGVD